MTRLSHAERAERRHAIIEAYKGGAEIEDLAIRFGLNPGYVRNVVSIVGRTAKHREALQRRIREMLVASRDAGLSRKETAKSLGKSYHWVVNWSNKLGVSFPHSAAPRGETERNAAIVALFDSGETLQDIGQRFGITRERVRQIVGRAGRTPRREVVLRERQELFERFRASGLSIKQFSDAEGVPYDNLKVLARDFGYTPPPAPRIIDDPKFIAMVDAVRDGRSIRSVADEAGVKAQLLGRACQEAGITSRHGRWKDFSERERIIRTLYAEGKSWTEIAAAVSRAECVKVGYAGARAWAVANLDLPKRVGSGSLRPPKRKAPAARTPISYPQVIVRETIRETAKANYGRCPASKIGDRLGVTRNVIIGHWNRLRAAGELSA